MGLQEQNPNLYDPDPQPKLRSYYAWIEAGNILPNHFAVQLFFELDKERGRTHRWMQINKSKVLEDVAIMEDKMKNIGEEMAELKFKEANICGHLQKENKKLKAQLQEEEEQIATMASFSMESIQC